MNRRSGFTAFCVAFLAITQGHAAEPSHPLDPLTWQEHWNALKILADTGRIDADSSFTRLALRPPEKASVWAWSEGEPFGRAAEAIVRKGEQTFEAVVDLDAGSVAEWSERTDVQPAFLGEEFDSFLIEEVMQDEKFLAAIEARGVEHPQYLDCALLPRGTFGEARFEGRRIAVMRCGDPTGVRNIWSRMIEGLVVIVDIDNEEILEISDDEVVPVPDAVADFDLSSVGELRKFPAPIEIDQPLGAGFKLDGNVVTWDRWTFHVRSDHRVGLIISTVVWHDGEEKRPVLYEGNLSELFVPYQAPYQNWYVATYLDAGEYSEGGFSHSMEPEVHCPRAAAYLDAIVPQDDGAPVDKRRVVCIFETYSGDVNWAHGSEGRPKRQLVVRMAARLDNYEYLFDWIFQTDGSIRISAAATGIVAARMASEANAAEAADKDYADSRYGRPDQYGRFVGDHIVALNHSHFFNFRFDLDVDGPVNSFETLKLTEVPMPDHPRRSFWVPEGSIAASERDAQVSRAHDRPALWRFINPKRTNRHGYPTGYQVLAGMSMPPLMSPDDPARQRAGFINHDLWVTPYAASERYAAGDFPTLSKPGEGLPKWTARDRPIAETDIVAWYTIGMHHVPRAEDWPVMPALRHEVTLQPFDFFDANPSLTSDVKP